MKISTQFAIDRNRDKKISKEEHVAFKELKTRDADDSGSLEGRELTDVFIQYGEDVWLEGGRRHRISGDGFTQIAAE